MPVRRWLKPHFWIANSVYVHESQQFLDFVCIYIRKERANIFLKVIILSDYFNVTESSFQMLVMSVFQICFSGVQERTGGYKELRTSGGKDDKQSHVDF